MVNMIWSISDGLCLIWVIQNGLKVKNKSELELKTLTQNMCLIYKFEVNFLIMHCERMQDL